MKPADFSVKNSLFINLVSLLLIIMGVYYWFNIRQEAFPNINLDMVTVSTAYIGATPQEVEKLLTIPIEEELAQVDDIDKITSVSTENFSTILIEIDPDTRNKNKVVQDIQRAVDRAKDLPDTIEDDPLVTEIQTKNVPVIQVSLSGLPQRELRRYAESLEDKLQDISGVASVQKSGWHDREIWVEADPVKVHDYYLSLNEIIGALRNKNLNLPGGTLEKDDSEFLIRTMGEFETADEIKQVIIRANEQGNWIRVGDVATVTDTFEDEDVIFKTNGRKSINLIVVKRESGDTIKVVKRVEKVVDEFLKTADKDLHIDLFDDISYYIKRRLGVLVNNGILGIILLTLSLLFFLKPRIALVTAVGLPVAFGATLLMMVMLGISINLISMFGMIIVLGMLVDDGIIISENSYRYIQQGYSPRDAAVLGTNEVAKPVVATILTTFAFFFPLFCMSGIMGKYVRNIPQVVILMLFASLIEALFILPSHIADFVPAASKEKEKERMGDRFFNVVVARYERIINSLVKKRYLTMLVVLGIAALAIFINIFFMKFILFTAEGIEEFYIRVEAPIGTPLEKTSELIEPLEQLLAQLPKNELDNFVTNVGRHEDRHEEEGVTTGSRYAQINVFLTPESARKRDTRQIIQYLRSKSQNIQGFTKISFDEVRPGPPVGKPIAVKVRGEHYEELETISKRLQTYLTSMDGVQDVKDDYTLGKEELRVIVDEKKAAQLYLTVRDIANAVRYAFDGGIATTIKTTDEEVDVIVKFPEHQQLDKTPFNRILVPNAFGKLIPLTKVASLKTEQGISSIKHLDRKRVITVSANVDENIITSAEVNKRLQEHFSDLSEEFLDVTITYGGEHEDTQESMRSLFAAFIWGFMIVFLILASTFGSLVQPAIVLTSIPLGLVGVIFAFFLHGKPFGFMSMMGSIGLAGVAVNDAIVLVEFINKLRNEGRERRESIIQAGKLRLRPVMLTTITTVAGLMPVAYGWGGSDPFIKPMALALSWGLVFATFSTLLVIPCIYAIVDDIRSKARPFFNMLIGRKKNNGFLKCLWF